MGHASAPVRLARALLPTGISRRRQLVSAAVSVVVLSVLTLLLDAWRDDVSLTIVFLLYLAAVVAIAAAGGPIVGIAVAIVAFLLVNFFFTEPLHTLDVSDPEHGEHVTTTNEILRDLGLEDMPRLRVFNKIDKLSDDERSALENQPDGVGISALEKATTRALLTRIESWLALIEHQRAVREAKEEAERALYEA